MLHLIILVHFKSLSIVKCLTPRSKFFLVQICIRLTVHRPWILKSNLIEKHKLSSLLSMNSARGRKIPQMSQIDRVRPRDSKCERSDVSRVNLDARLTVRANARRKSSLLFSSVQLSHRGKKMTFTRLPMDAEVPVETGWGADLNTK